MKTIQNRSCLFIALGALLFGACQKDSTPASSGTTAGPSMADTISPKTAAVLARATPLSLTGTPGCTNAPDYGDSIIHTKSNNGQDYIVSPLNNNSTEGTYFAWPGGLVLDSVTGAINVTQSETGQRYAIGFSRKGGADTCVSIVILGGADYVDSAYVASSGRMSADPLFNANPNSINPCLNGGCTFDYNHQALNQGVYVDKNTGKIDLQNTLDHSLFSIWNVDGAYFYTTINYISNLSGTNVPQAITVQMMYYNNRSDVPADLLNSIQAQASTVRTGQMSAVSKARPPLIVITKY